MKEMKTICTFIFVLLLGCLCCQGQMTGSISPFSSKDVNYYDLYNKYVKAKRDESLNAAPYYKKAFDLFVNLLPDIND